jgi:ribonuclease D
MPPARWENNVKELLINKLAEQAGITPVAIHTDPLVVSYHMSHETMDKFVELIVKECIDKAFHNGHPDLEFLLKHFGVE